MKILLFGKNGQLGWELQRSLAPLGELVALDARSKDGAGDFTQLAALAETVQQLRPDLIVNAAAYTTVDRAESEPELARTINALAPGVLAEEAHKLGALMVHYSTDYVFDGSGERPWRENDTPSPLNVYGRTKLEGEQRVRAATARHLVFRTSWVYAARGSNFARTMLRLARERERLTVIADQFGAPTGADLLADVTAHAIRQLQVKPENAGLYHLAAAGETSWHGYAQWIVDCARRAPRAAEIRVTAIEPIPAQAYPLPATRPHNSRLDTSLLQATFGLVLPSWQSGVQRMLAEIDCFSEAQP